MPIRFASNISQWMEIASTGQPSLAVFASSSHSGGISSTWEVAFPSSLKVKTVSHVPTHRPHAMHVSSSTTAFIELSSPSFSSGEFLCPALFLKESMSNCPENIQSSSSMTWISKKSKSMPSIKLSLVKRVLSIRLNSEIL